MCTIGTSTFEPELAVLVAREPARRDDGVEMPQAPLQHAEGSPQLRRPAGVETQRRQRFSSQGSRLNRQSTCVGQTSQCSWVVYSFSALP